MPCHCRPFLADAVFFFGEPDYGDLHIMIPYPPKRERVVKAYRLCNRQQREWVTSSIVGMYQLLHSNTDRRMYIAFEVEADHQAHS